MLPATHKHQSCGDYQPGGSAAEHSSRCLGDGIDDGLYSIRYSVSILSYIMHSSYSYYDNLQIYKYCREKLRMNNEEMAQQHDILSVSVGPVLFFLFKAQRTSLLKKNFKCHHNQPRGLSGSWQSTLEIALFSLMILWDLWPLAEAHKRRFHRGLQSVGRLLGNKRSCLDKVGKEQLEKLAVTTHFLLVLAGARLMGM